MITAALAEVLVIDILHTGKGILLFVFSSNISRSSLVEAAGALKPFVIILRSVSWVSCLSLAGSLLHQLILITQADHII